MSPYQNLAAEVAYGLYRKLAILPAEMWSTSILHARNLALAEPHDLDDDARTVMGVNANRSGFGARIRLATLDPSRGLDYVLSPSKCAAVLRMSTYYRPASPPPEAPPEPQPADEVSTQAPQAPPESLPAPEPATEVERVAKALSDRLSSEPVRVVALAMQRVLTGVAIAATIKEATVALGRYTQHSASSLRKRYSDPLGGLTPSTAGNYDAAAARLAEATLGALRSDR